MDKPAGMVVHPGAGVASGTLVHALLHRDPRIAAVGGAGRPGIVHRLDRDTSGLLVVARTARAYRALVDAIKNRDVKRRYLALVWGGPGPAEGSVEGAIGRDPRHRQRMAVVGRGGKPARTRWRVAERFGWCTALDVALETGRTHQIRAADEQVVHVSRLVGWKVPSDLPLRLTAAERSLAEELLDRLPRQALHASELEFAHPIRGVRLHFEAPLPLDIAGALSWLRGLGQPRRGPTAT